MIALTAESVAVRRGKQVVVHDVDLSVATGEVVALLGPNGAGKSTLLECLGGVIAPASGTVTRTGRTATVLQTPGLAQRSVRANVELALAWWGVPRRERRARALEALEQMRAGHLAKRPAGALSGGERRRVHVARGVAVRPDVLLLDEPFAGLDGETHQGLVEDTGSALRQTGGAVVVVVHDRADAWALADRVVVMTAGRVVADGAPRDLLAAPPSAEVARFLGYDGCLRRGAEQLLTRPVHVRVDPQGELAGAVTRVVGQEDGVLLEVLTDAGSLRCRDTGTWRVGEPIRLTVSGGVAFPYPEGMAEFLRIGEVATALGVSVDTLRRWEGQGRVTFERHNGQRVLSADALRPLLASHTGANGSSSARNRFAGIVTNVVRGKVMAQVEMACGDYRVVSLMSSEALDELGIGVGSSATAIIKATNVIVEA